MHPHNLLRLQADRTGLQELRKPLHQDNRQRRLHVQNQENILVRNEAPVLRRRHRVVVLVAEVQMEARPAEVHPEADLQEAADNLIRHTH